MQMSNKEVEKAIKHLARSSLMKEVFLFIEEEITYAFKEMRKRRKKARGKK